MSTPSRNQPCPCGSGRRYKDCHGQLAGAAGRGEASAERERCMQLMRQALAMQEARRLDEAERLYREALAIRPDEPDALHMLGVIRYERDDLAEARTLVVRALDLCQWRVASMRQNLGLILVRERADRDSDASLAMRHRYRTMLADREARRHAATPLVSVVVPSFNHARFVERALRSVFEQSYRHIELVVIDDGSHDGSPELIESVLRQSPFPQRLVARANRGATTTLNEGIAVAHGSHIQFLNSDDWFAPDRVERMVAAIAGTDSAWGFSSVEVVDAEGRLLDPLRNRAAWDLHGMLGNVPFRETVGSGFITGNVGVSSGNLFFSRALLDQLGGFREYRYNHDWDICLRALVWSEPVFVPERLYTYRLHAGNTIAESADRARAEARIVCAQYMDRACGGSPPDNPFAPTRATWGQLFTNMVLSGGMGGLLEPESFRQLIAVRDPAAAHPGRRAARGLNSDAPITMRVDPMPSGR